MREMAGDPPSGLWTGFFLEKHQPHKGWMHLSMEFKHAIIYGEGTDYVGPWQIQGNSDTETAICRWVKQYLGKHRVQYEGQFGETGIVGKWNISGFLQGDFHIWPADFTEIQEMYLRQEEQDALKRFGSGLKE